MPNEDPRYLREQAAKCRQLASTVLDEKTARVLRDLAVEYDERSRALTQEPRPEAPAS